MHRSNQYPEQVLALLLDLFERLSSGVFPAFLGLSQVEKLSSTQAAA